MILHLVAHFESPYVRARTGEEKLVTTREKYIKIYYSLWPTPLK